MDLQELPRPVSWKSLKIPPASVCLVILLLLSLTCGGLTRDQYCDNFDNEFSHIQTNISCKISSSGNGNAEINVSWLLSPKQTAVNIITSDLFRSFNVFCNCSLSGNFTMVDTDFDGTSISQHSAQFSNFSMLCYDECSCFVYFNTHCSVSNPRSDPSTCYNEPAVPKAPPVIISPPVRIFSNEENSIQVKFKLPPVNLYCDNSITNITVDITQHDNGSHHDQYPKSYNQPLSTLKNDNSNYVFRFKFPVEQFQFWTPFDIAISVNNTVGPTSFSNYVTIKKDDNTILKSDYKFLCHYNDELSMLYLYWNLSVKAKSMLNSHFITGFQFTMEQLNDNRHNMMTYYMNNTNLTLNMSLKSNEWYLLIGRILLKDNEIYGPEPSYAYFKTPAATDKHSSSIANDDHKYYVIVLSISGFLTIIVVLLLVYIKIRFKKPSHNYVQLSDHDDDDSDNNTGDDDDDDDDIDVNVDDDKDSSVKMHALGSVVGSSYMENMDDPSVVENL